MIDARTRKRAVEDLRAAHRRGSRFPAVLFWKVTERQVVLSPYAPKPRRDLDELSAFEVREILDQARALGTRKVVFTGSDPILWDRFGEVLAHARRAGMRTEVTSWGPLVADKADDLALADRVAIPLFGTERIHDSTVVGREIFSLAVAGLQALRARGVPVTIDFAPTHRNSTEIEPLLDLADRHGADLRLVAPPLAGRVREVAERYFPDNEQLRCVVDICVTAKRARGALVRNSRASLEAIRAWPKPVDRPNLAGALYGAVDPEGRLIASERMHPAESVGNLRARPLEELFALIAHGKPRRSEAPDALELELLCADIASPADAAAAVFG